MKTGRGALARFENVRATSFAPRIPLSSLVPGDAQPAAIAYWDVDDIAATFESLVAAGGAVEQDITDVARGLLVATVRYPGGTIVGVRQIPKG